MKRNNLFEATACGALLKLCRLTTGVVGISVILIISGISVNAQSKDRDEPTSLTTGDISGLIDSESKGSVYYYTFVVTPGEVVITLSVQSDPPTNTYGSSLKSVSFTLFDRNAEAIASNSVATYYGGGTGQAVSRVNVTRRQPVVLGINIPGGIVNSGTGKYRLRINGAVEFGKDTSSSRANTGITDEDLSAYKSSSRLRECLPKQGTIIVKMKDGSKKIIDLSDAEEVTIVP